MAMMKAMAIIERMNPDQLMSERVWAGWWMVDRS